MFNAKIHVNAQYRRCQDRVFAAFHDAEYPIAESSLPILAVTQPSGVDAGHHLNIYIYILVYTLNPCLTKQSKVRFGAGGSMNIIRMCVGSTTLRPQRIRTSLTLHIVAFLGGK